MTLFLFLLILIGIIFFLAWIYDCGKKQGREEAYKEKSIEVIQYNGKEVVLINEAYFTMEQAQQIAEAIKKKNPVIYKPKKQ